MIHHFSYLPSESRYSYRSPAGPTVSVGLNPVAMAATCVMHAVPTCTRIYHVIHDARYDQAHDAFHDQSRASNRSTSGPHEPPLLLLASSDDTDT
ncbi:hypothetical protein B296_00007920 [Ensete ventricosum]|uniref:Uncharacterized protein n=1 Tax=Ensete ventricosum TaxID=4639 RepID=A0A427AUH0_ENSVE|nr:hypothetical protein B296_00007920 [Ensete ventricosum]